MPFRGRAGVIPRCAFFLRSLLSGAQNRLGGALDLPTWLGNSQAETLANVVLLVGGSLDADSGSLRGVQDLLGALAGGGGSALWREKAVDLFYRDFSMEDLDLQVRVPQELFSNEHTAMVFCKMPCQVREHWVRSLRNGLR
ncbi:hypothetical protein NLG97_g6223 [Lecanicillium saksenae]|uniref:Uncharacterized protein n=1 Tax=Lecanicillium saksenae TaxID=468837 RepID=A0ACC1QQD2_9HYPO|nr:hypothetical protein NLG97_g6223 [Lecanicillium saksenae]